MESWLNSALDMGITEQEFWSLTIAELERRVNSIKRVKLDRAREKASYDYIQAELIGRSMARLYSSSATYPDISEAYPTLFDGEEIKRKKQEKQAELSALRFKQFADSYNKKWKEEKQKNE